MKRVYRPSPKQDLRKCAGLESLLHYRESAKYFSLAEFYQIASGDGLATGSLVYEVDGGMPLILNDGAETRFLALIAESGFASSIRGQTKRIDYTKPWATTPSPYYPDFVFRTYDGRVALVEIKSILGMAQDENIAKMEALFAYAHARGFMAAYIDAEFLSFQEYLEPLAPNAYTHFFEETVAAIGGFTNQDLLRMEKAFPKAEKKTLKRIVSSLILQNPYLLNRYCHDSPDLVNAVKVPTPLAYKRFR
ncbi:MAG: hypothetical protein WCS90_04190 [Bacilli bacterium]